MWNWVKPNSRKAAARAQVDIREVRDDVLILPNHQYRAVLAVSPVNFVLKSDAEQDVTIDTFEQFVNSLPCPIQILMRTREIDVDHYLDTITALRRHESSDLYQKKLSEYTSFIKKLVAGNKLLSRRFYIVVPFQPADRSMDFGSIKEQLNLYADVITSGLERIGMKATRVSGLDILNLFYSFYNPAKPKVQPLEAARLKNAEDIVYAS